MGSTHLVAIVTGGGTGIGKAVSKMLAARGVSVAINFSRSQRDAEATLEEIVQSGGDGCTIQADVTDDDAVRAMVKSVVEKYGRLDILINNAGATTFVPLHDLESLKKEHWEQAFTTNVEAAFNCSRAAAPHLKESGRGAIVNVASVAGITGRGSSIAYAASKAAMISLTKSLARVLAPEVRVNAVAPGFVKTRWTAGRTAFEDDALRRTPLKRLAEPEDPAAVAVALALDFRQVTGETIVVDGGSIL